MSKISELQAATDQALVASHDTYKALNRLFIEVYFLRALTSTILLIIYYYLSVEPSYIPGILLSVAIGFDIATLVRKPYKNQIFMAMDAYSQYRMFQVAIQLQKTATEIKNSESKSS